MLNILLILLLLALSMTFMKNALHMFQQNRYEPYRYTKWLFNKKNIHFTIAFIYIILAVVLAIIFRRRRIFIYLLNIIFSIIFIYREAKKEYVKDLVYTGRVKRQIVVFIILMFGILWLLSSFISYSFLGIFAIYLPYLLIYVLYLITEPIENMIKKRYENEARDILNKMDLIKVGITGSYGKTSTKNIVTDIIKDNYYTLMTPASYNTPMGITRTIRENLKPIHEVFICEMGADKVGEITYLMDFVKPKYGIVTSIGPQHLNTFHDMDNIIHEKMQMIEKLPSDGTGIINIDNEYIKNYKIQNDCKIIKVGIENDEADITARNISYSKDGSTFTVNLDGIDYEFKTVLLGKHNITNVLFAIALAKCLGVDNETIVKNASNVRQVEHRLELRNIGGFTFIDNAFNSNPVSSKLSLDVLEMMPGKRIIVTPGLIDLGDKEDAYNFEFGRYMVNKADFVILVGHKNTEHVYKGLQEAFFDMNNVLVVSSEKEAFDYIYRNFSTEDTILLENDLPDAFLS